MNRTDAPKKQPVPFGINGSREDLLATTPAGDNQASYDAGFPPVTMILKSAGGLPPKGQDMNQILFELSSICRWMTAGALNAFDATFAAAISGYPKGAVLISDDNANIFISTIDGNTNNPNSSSTGWLSFLSFLGGAPLASPTFTGDPKAPTPSPGDNDTSIATTAFVTSAIAALGTAASRNVGTSTNQIPDMNSFGSLLGSSQGASGWQKLPGGLIIQWYTAVMTAAGNQTFNFPIPFPNYFLSDAVTVGGAGSNVVNGGNVSKTSRQFFSNAALSISVICVGW